MLVLLHAEIAFARRDPSVAHSTGIVFSIFQLTFYSKGKKSVKEANASANDTTESLADLISRTGVDLPEQEPPYAAHLLAAFMLVLCALFCGVVCVFLRFGCRATNQPLRSPPSSGEEEDADHDELALMMALASKVKDGADWMTEMEKVMNPKETDSDEEEVSDEGPGDDE